MKLTSILGSTRKADITFHPNGKIDITSRIVKALDIRAGDVIDIMKGGGEFYLFVSSRSSDNCGRHQAVCYPSKRGAHHFRTYSIALTIAIIPASSRAVGFPAGEVVEVNGHRAIPIITKFSNPCQHRK